MEKTNFKIHHKDDSSKILLESRNFSAYEFKSWSDFVSYAIRNEDVQGANLKYANISNLDLSYLELTNVDLSNSNLSNTNLSYSNLSNANLSTANLASSTFYKTNLTNANLSNTELRNAKLNRANLNNTNMSGAIIYKTHLNGAEFNNTNVTETPLNIFSNWNIYYTLPDLITIGCEKKTIAEWDDWFKNSKEEYDNPRNSKIFQQIFAHYSAVKTYIEMCLSLEIFEKTVDSNGKVSWNTHQV